MISRFQLLRNVGQFDSVSVPSQLTFSKMTLFYAENGRGKTTLAAILRSLGSGNPKLITERKRLAAVHGPHIVLSVGTLFTFEKGLWNNAYSDLSVFDDTFVAENVCSGVEIGTEHRQNLHELILGAQGVSLNAALQTLAGKIEEHNKTIKAKSDAIPATERGAHTVDAFCTLKPKLDVDQLIQQAERSLAAARSAESVAQQGLFASLTLPSFDLDAVSILLQRDLPSLDTASAARVQAHLTKLGKDGEGWVSRGMALVEPASQGQQNESCPFCAQGLNSSFLMEAYRSYFGAAYSELKASIEATLTGILRLHSGDAPAAFERAVRLASERREFWKAFVDIPDLAIDTAAIARAWKRAREAMVAALTRKKESPLDSVGFTAYELESFSAYEASAAEVLKFSETLMAVNPSIAVAKEQAASGNATTLAADLAVLKPRELATAQRRILFARHTLARKLRRR